MKRLISILIVIVSVLCPLAIGSANALPISLVSFLSAEKQPDLTQAVELHVSVNRCLYGEPQQIIRDEQIVRQAVDALTAITVLGQHDQMSSTDTYFAYGLYDADGNHLFSSCFQNGFLMMDDGRYDVDGLDALLQIDGILLDDDWDAYWQADEEAEAAYLDDLNPSYPESIFTLRGLAASRLQAEDITYVEIYVSRHDDAGRLSTSQPEMIRRVFSALQRVQATSTAPEDGDGLTYYVTLSYQEPEGRFGRSVWFRFEGDRLECDQGTYRVSGLDGLFSIGGVDVLAYLKENYMAVH